MKNPETEIDVFSKMLYDFLNGCIGTPEKGCLFLFVITVVLPLSIIFNVAH